MAALMRGHFSFYEALMDRRDRISRILVISAVVVVGVIAVVVILGWLLSSTSVGTYAVNRFIFPRDPVTWITPTDLPDLAVSPALGPKLNYSGYECESPWVDIETAKIKETRDIAIVPSRSGRHIIFRRLNPRSIIDQYLKSEDERKEWRDKYGEEWLRTDFNFVNLVLEANPKKITPFTDSETQKKILVRAIMKMMLVDPSTKAIYRIQTREWKGFEFADENQKNEKWVHAWIWSNTDAVDVALLPAKGAATTAIPQADMNLILQTLHSTRSYEPPPASAPKPETETSGKAGSGKQP